MIINNVDRNPWRKLTRSSAVAKKPLDASCLYSFNTKRRTQSFIISCFGFRYTTAYNKILICSLLFGVLVHAAGRHKHSLVSRRLRSTLHGWVTVFGTSHVQQSSIAKVLLDQKRDLCLYLTCIRRPVRGGGSRRNIATPFGLEKLEWCGYPTVKNFRRLFIRFETIHERDRQTDGRTDTA